jgi:hypothetical protein
MTKKLTKKDNRIIGGVSLFPGFMFFWLLSLFTTSFTFGNHYDVFTRNLYSIESLLSFFFFFLLFSSFFFFFLRWIYKNTVKGFWIIFPIVIIILLLGLSYYDYILIRLFS